MEGRRERMVTDDWEEGWFTGRFATLVICIYPGVCGGEQPPHVPERDQTISGRSRGTAGATPGGELSINDHFRKRQENQNTIIGRERPKQKPHLTPGRLKERASRQD